MTSLMKNDMQETILLFTPDFFCWGEEEGIGKSENES